MESKANLVALIACLAALPSFVLLLALPIMTAAANGGYYCYAQTGGQEICYPKYATTQMNALSYALSFGNWLPIPTLVVYLVSISLGGCSFVPKAGPLRLSLLISFYALFLISKTLFAIFMGWVIPIWPTGSHNF